MVTKRIAWLKAVAVIASLFFLLSPAWSDGDLGFSGSDHKKLCYCMCDHMYGSPMCTHMCDLPKYENRSWAVSCHKTPQHAQAQTPATTPGHSKKSNRPQFARL